MEVTPNHKEMHMMLSQLRRVGREEWSGKGRGGEKPEEERVEKPEEEREDGRRDGRGDRGDETR